MALNTAGRDAEALQALRAGLPPTRQTADDQFDYVMLAIRSASILDRTGHGEDAERELEHATVTLGPTPYTVNLRINRAAMVAHHGRFAEALQALDEALADMAQQDPDIAMSGADHQFAWIRACALWGLGRREEAKQIVDTLGTVGDRPGAVFGTTIPNLRIRMRMCMRDYDGAAEEMIASLRANTITTLAFRLSQPGLDSDIYPDAAYDALRAMPRLMEEISARLRRLPESYGPALHSWRADRVRD